MAKRNLKLMVAVEEGLIRGEPSTQLVTRLAAKFKLVERTIWTYVKRVYERWAKEEEELRPMRRAQFRQMVMENFRLSLDSGEPGAGASTLRLLAKLDGLEAPSKVEITGQLNVKALDPIERRKKIEILMAKRAEALDGTCAPDMLQLGEGVE